MSLFNKLRPVKEIYLKYERHLTTLFFVLGFAVDTFTLTRVDLWINNAILSGYIGIAILGVIFYNSHVSGRFKESTLARRLALITPPIIQFVFGGLFSSFVVFYSRSASLIDSWPFLFFLGAVFIGNEIFRKKYELLAFQVSILFVAVFSYLIFLVPVIVGEMGPKIFFISGIFSLIIIWLVLFVLSITAKEKTKKSEPIALAVIFAIYAIFNWSYYANLIPPIPLALKEIGAYHALFRTTEGNYIASFEPDRWYPFKKTSSVFNRTLGGPVYVFSAIFAPTKLNTSIIHEWSHFEPELQKWIVTDTFKFPIYGGRDGGYRGYTVKNYFEAGKWRVDVKTERNQTIGYVLFDVVDATTTPSLIETIY